MFDRVLLMIWLRIVGSMGLLEGHSGQGDYIGYLMTLREGLGDSRVEFGLG